MEFYVRSSRRQVSRIQRTAPSHAVSWFVYLSISTRALPHFRELHRLGLIPRFLHSFINLHSVYPTRTDGLKTEPRLVLFLLRRHSSAAKWVVYSTIQRQQHVRPRVVEFTSSEVVRYSNANFTSQRRFQVSSAILSPSNGRRPNHFLVNTQKPWKFVDWVSYQLLCHRVEEERASGRSRSGERTLSGRPMGPTEALVAGCGRAPGRSLTT